jgi:hypothetical protein
LRGHDSVGSYNRPKNPAQSLENIESAPEMARGGEPPPTLGGAPTPNLPASPDRIATLNGAAADSKPASVA